MIPAIAGGRISRGYSLLHDGVDIAAPTGTPVPALRGGTVVYSADARTDPNAGRYWARGGGNVVVIEWGGGRYRDQYAHLHQRRLGAGSRIAAGMIVGTVGATGNATGPHLHFGVFDTQARRMVDPARLQWGGGGSTPAPAPALDAWAGLVSFPVGHVITESDVRMMVSKLDAAGWFGQLGPGWSAMAAYSVLATAIGKPWNKALQDDLQRRFGLAAQQAGANPLDSLGGALGVLPGLIGSTLTDVGRNLMLGATALVLVIMGLWLVATADDNPAARW